ncbi:hypothetical protein H0A36_07270 [Endozoicomonas sp. SM1973]|uniref:Uncharacterized protein n=1 Tax=Spartinivicinus marinus TaxID=2994442 RepID=A0A853HVM5_9GAMM|nr:hypothetical protein [Spartinivicinus marinus]MCX4025817.1 hypothetical protein [Spartinivicinus marinus]NYZ65810.1 hypothetical protein [Spartinivicinus marinus]
MEEGPKACPESNQQANLAEYIRSRKHFKENVLTPWEYKKLKMADWLQWRYFAYWLEEWQQKRMIKKIPQEIQAWSQPIPEDQWAKPSEQLLEAEKITQAYYQQGGKFGDKDMPIYQPK